MDVTAIDWQQPWLAHLRDIGQPLAASTDWLLAANTLARHQGVSNAAGLPIRFVPQHSVPEAAGYEAHIHATGQVPTRDNLHDFFNALIWLHFPSTKRMLNQLQAKAIQHNQSTARRGAQRDAATLFDENAALFLSNDPAMIDQLARHEWKALLLADPVHFARRGRVILFGHALLEKLVHPYKAITAHVWCELIADDVGQVASAVAPALSPSLADVDQCIAASITPGFVSRDFSHLPVLGVPGWWRGQDEAFYDDVSVFRPVRNKSPR